MKKPSYIAATLSLFLALNGCITDYVPGNIDQLSNILVVESTITNGTTHVKLSRSVGLSDPIGLIPPDNYAVVIVETEDGSFEREGIADGLGGYTIEIGELNPLTKYRLHIYTYGYEYVSSYLAPVITPPIDSVSWQKQGMGQPVHLCVSTHGTNDQSIYYRWSFKEHWELKAEYFANAAIIDHGFDNRELVFYDLLSSNNRYYCWAQDSSKVLLLDNSAKLDANIIPQKRLTEISPYDERLSLLYYIAVSQTSLREEAYLYFKNIQKNIEQTGGIFSSVPSESKGNITCLSDPDIPVIGYIEVATTTNKELYIPESAGAYEEQPTNCWANVTSDPEISGNELLYYDERGRETTYAPPKCVNCLTKRLATKHKPSWWPTAHL